MTDSSLVDSALVKQYNLIDLRIHPYMYTFHDYVGENAKLEFFRHIMTEEKHVLTDFQDGDIYEAFRRQYEEFVGAWDKNCERAFNRVILILHK